MFSCYGSFGQHPLSLDSLPPLVPLGERWRILRVFGITGGGNLCSSGCPWGVPWWRQGVWGVFPVLKQRLALVGVARQQHPHQGPRQDETAPSPPNADYRGSVFQRAGWLPAPASLASEAGITPAPLLSQLYGTGRSVRRSLSWKYPYSSRNLFRAVSAAPVGVILLSQFFLPNRHASGCVLHQLQVLLVLVVVPATARLVWEGATGELLLLG